MNIIDLLESPGMGRPRDTNGIQSAADQSAASVIGSGTTKREEKKKPVTMMGKNIKEGFDLGGVKNWLLKLKQGLSTEAEETKVMFDTYVRYTQGQASEQEMAAANEQFKDLLRGLGMGTLAAMPGSVVTLPLVFKLAKKFNIELMPSAFKNDVEEAEVKPNFKMPPESLQDKMYRQHQELRKQRGAPSAEEYKQRIAQKQKEIDDLKEGILDRGVPKMPKPRNPANAVLGNKVNAAGKHLDKKRRQELNPKHKHQDPLEEGWKDAVAGAALAGSIALGGMAHAGEPVVGQGQSQNMQMAVDMAKMNAKMKYMKTVHGDNFQDKQMPEYHWGKVDLKPGKDGGYQATVPLIVDNEVQESTGQLNWTVHFDDGTSQQVTVPSDEFDVRGYFAKRGKKVVKIDYSFAAQDRQDAPRRGTDDPAAGADSLAKAQAAYDRGLTEQAVEEEFRLGKRLGTRRDRFKSLRKRKEGILGEVGVSESQAVKITDYDTWSDEVKALGGEIHPQKDRNVLVAQSWDGEEIGKFHLGKSMGFINQSGDLDETIRKMGSQYRLLSKKGKNLGTFDSKAGAEKHEREVQYFKHKNMEEGVAEGWKGKLAGAALAGAAALGGGDVDAQHIDLPGPQVSYVAHVSAEANGREVHRTVNLGSRYSSEQDAYDDIERSLQAKGITRYNINIEQRYDAQYYPGSNQPRGGSATGRDYGTPGIGDMVIKHIGREIRAGIPDRGGYATGGTNQGQRPRDGSQWWKDQLPRIKEDTLEEDIESHLYLMSRAGYDIVQEAWSDKYKDSINCSNPKGFSQKAHCAGKKKNKSVSEAVATPPAQTTDPYQQKLLDRMGARFGLQPGATMDQVQAAQQAHLDKNDPAAAAQYKQNMTNINTGNTSANKPVQLAPKTPNPDTTAALAAGKANKSPTAIMLSQPGIGQNQAMLDAIAPTLGLPVGSSLEQLLAADDARHAKGGGKYAPSSQPVGEDMNQAVDSKGRTQQQWMQLVKDKFPDAKIIQSKMINGPCRAILSDGRKLSWSKVKEDVAEEKVRLDPKCWTGKKIGNPKTKIKGGVRVNNCVPK